MPTDAAAAPETDETAAEAAAPETADEAVETEAEEVAGEDEIAGEE